MEAPVHGKSWRIPRPSLWWKSRPSSDRRDAEVGVEDNTGRYQTHRESVSSGHYQTGGSSNPGYAASNASTASSASSNITPVGSLHSPLVRGPNTRPAWIPTALPSLVLDGGLKKNEQEGTTVAGLDALPKNDEDTVSIASSTHFTVVGVGGYGGGGRRRRGDWGLKAGKITALVLSMSLLILVGILAAILFLELRARSMKGHIMST